MCQSVSSRFPKAKHLLRFAVLMLDIVLDIHKVALIPRQNNYQMYRSDFVFSDYSFIDEEGTFTAVLDNKMLSSRKTAFFVPRFLPLPRYRDAAILFAKSAKTA